MKRKLRLVVIFMVALGVAPFLPLYIERTMLRSWRVDRAGDTIEWGWKVRSLWDYWSDYSYFRPEQQPAFWLGVNIILALFYALLITFIIERLVAIIIRRSGPASSK